MKIWIQQIAFVDYRHPIFRLIAKSFVSDDVRFMGGDKLRDPGLNILKAIDIDKEASIPIIRLKNNFWGRGWCWQGSIILRSIFGKFDVIVLQGDLTIVSNWLVQAIALIRGKRVLLWTHGIYGNEGKLKLSIRLVYLMLSSGLLLYGNYSRELLEKIGFNTKKLYVVYNSCSHPHLDEVESLRHDRSDNLKTLFQKQVPSRILVFVGRLTEVKRLDMLIESVARLCRQKYDIGLLVIGDGSEAENLKSQVRKLEISENVCFYGACFDPAKVAKLLSLGDLCVSPGNVGLTAMSALASGVPVISHKNFSQQMPEFEAIEPERTGNFFEEGNVEDLTCVIARWLDGKVDRQTVSNDCRKMIANYYNPEIQLQILRGAVENIPASNLPRRNITQK